MKYFAGLDVSLNETAICVVDEDGIVVTEGKAASEPGDLVRWLVATGLTITRVGLEAGPLSPWLHAELRAAGLPADFRRSHECASRMRIMKTTSLPQRLKVRRCTWAYQKQARPKSRVRRPKSFQDR